MKKKQLTSILLAGIMILGLCVPAFADGQDANNEGSGGQSTNVEYTAPNNESYLLTVPANMAPGDTDNVSLTGSWPSTRTMKVSADTNVVLTNSINANDKKTLTVSFNEIALAGNNNETVSATEEVSVQDITNANFGEWSGRFSYYVNSEGTGADDPIEYQIPTLKESGNALRSPGMNYREATSVKFVDSYTPTGNEDETWFADVDNGTVPETQITGYRIGREIIIAGNGTGKIMANENCSKMFFGMLGITNLDLSMLDTSNVENMEYMFAGCNGLKSINLSGFNVEKVTKMGRMFDSCYSLTTLDLSGFRAYELRDAENMFNGCENLTSLNMFSCGYEEGYGKFGYLFGLYRMNGMFGGCEKLTSLDLSNLLIATNNAEANNMFYGCSKLENIYVGSKWSSSNIGSSTNMFYNCTSLPNFDSSTIDCTNAHTGEGGYLTLKT